MITIVKVNTFSKLKIFLLTFVSFDKKKYPVAGLQDIKIQLQQFSITTLRNSSSRDSIFTSPTTRIFSKCWETFLVVTIGEKRGVLLASSI